jgi:hypothetical protein
VKRWAARDGENARRCGLISLSGAIGFVAPPGPPDLPGGGPCGCTLMRVSISSVFDPPEAGAELLPAGNESGECAAESIALALASLDGGEAASSAATLVAKTAAKASVSARETNLSFRWSLIVMSRSLCRLRPLGATGTMSTTQAHDLDRRYNNQEDDRTDEHPTDDDCCERPLHLAADAGRDRRGQKPDTSRQRSHQHRAHAL